MTLGRPESCFWPQEGSPGRSGGLSTTTFVKRGLPIYWSFGWDEDLAAFLIWSIAALQSGRAAPFAVADLITAISARSARTLKCWRSCWPTVSWRENSMAKIRPASAVRTLRSSLPHYRGEGAGPPRRSGVRQRLSVLALVDAIDSALRSAAEIARRADQLLVVAPKLRTKRCRNDHSSLAG